MKKYMVGLLLSAPWLALAQQGDFNEQGLVDIGDAILNLLTGVVVPIIFALALIYFLWGVAKYVISGGDASKKKEASMIMVWGIIGLTVMASVWGLVNILKGTIGGDVTDPGDLPTINGGNNR